jgi:hypothetical protein
MDLTRVAAPGRALWRCGAEGATVLALITTPTERRCDMSDHGSASLFQIAFYCIALAAAGLWALKHLDFPF